MSSSFLSSVPSCAIRVQPIPTKPTPVTKVVRVYNTTVFIDDKGRIYCSAIRNGFTYSMSWMDRQRFQDLYQCLVKLGVISKEDADAHLAEAEDITKKRESKRAAESVRRDVKTLGLKLTAAQLRLLEAAAPEKNNG